MHQFPFVNVFFTNGHTKTISTCQAWSFRIAWFSFVHLWCISFVLSTKRVLAHGHKRSIISPSPSPAESWPCSPMMHLYTCCFHQRLHWISDFTPALFSLFSILSDHSSFLFSLPPKVTESHHKLLRITIVMVKPAPQFRLSSLADLSTILFS